MVRFLTVLITLMMVVTCFNIQAIRDNIVSEPAPIESYILDKLEVADYGASRPNQ